MMAAIASVMKEYIKQRGQLPPLTPGAGPSKWVAGAQPTVNVQWLSDEDLTAIQKEVAEAEVVERFIENVKWFLTGVMVGA